jgi:Fe-S-cluster containining protein
MNRHAQLVAEALAEIRAVYRELDARPVARDCQRRTECCQFKLTGRTPMLTRGEALVAAKAVRAAGRRELPVRDDGVCPLLRPNGACMIYADRPFGCRTHFCAAAGGPYARAEVRDLVRRLEAVDSRIEGDGPRALEAAVADALRSI